MDIAGILTESLGDKLWGVIPLGLFLGLLGFRIHKVSLFFIGLFAGFLIGVWIGDSFGDEKLGLILGVVAGLTLGIINLFLLRISLFLAGMICGIIAANMIINGTGIDIGVIQGIEIGPIQMLLWFVIAALGTGLLTMLLYQFMIVLVTSGIGVYLILIGTKDLDVPPEAKSWMWMLYVILFLVFILVQFATMRGRPDILDSNRNYSRG